MASKNPLGIFNDGNKDGGLEGAGGGQATAVGDGAIASSQATAVGNDVYALGRSSIALGNDDVATYRDVISDYDAKNYFYKLYSKIDPNGEKYGYRVEGNSLVASGARSTLDDGTQTYKNIWSPTLSQGDGSIAIGSRSIAYDAGSTALGTLAFALKKGSTAIGTQTRAEGVGALAFGSKSYVFSDNSIAVGSKSQVLKTGGTAYGYRTYAGGNNSIAIGRDVYANAKMNFGTGSNGQEVFSANGLYNFNPAASARTILESSTAVLNTFEDIIKAGGDENGAPGLGTYAMAVSAEHNGVANIVQENGQNAIVLGSRSLAQGDNGLALGRGAIERGNNSMAIGSYSMTDGDNAVALGLASRAVAKNSMALGTATATMGNSSLAIGIGAINYGNSSLVLGNTSGIGSDTAGSVVLGTNTIIGSNVNRSIAIGNGASVGSYTRGENGGVMKIDHITGKPTSKTITSVEEMEREDSLQNAMAIGSNARVYSREAVNTTSGDSGYASMNGKNAMAIGNNAQAWLENSLALGVDSRTDYTPQQLATDAWRTPDAIAVSTTSKVGVISVGSIGNERRIVNVAAGAYDTDAVNVSQLKQTYESLSRQLNSNTAQSGSHFISTNYSAIDNGSGVVDYVKKQFMQDTYERYIKAYTDYKGYLVKEQYGGAKLTDTAKQNFNAELTKLENDLRAAGMSQEQINRLMVNTYGGGQKQYASDGTTITGVTVDKASLTNPTVAGAIDQLTKAQQQDIFNVATITGMTADELKDKLSEINYDNSQAQGKGSIAIGYSAGTTQEGGLALGYKAKVLAQDDFVAGSVALGDKSTVSDTDLEATKQAGKQYKTAIAGKASTPNGGVVSVGTTRSDDGYQPMTRRIINVAAGYNDTDAVNVAQLTSLAAQEITLQDGQNRKTTAQAIGKDGGVNFELSGDTSGDITTSASGTTVTFGLNKAASVTNTGDDVNKVVTSNAVYNAVTGAKTKVAANEADTTGILTIGKTESQDLTANNYRLGINTEKLKEVLANDFVSKKDGLTADISYTANGAAAKKVGLSAGLNFTNTDNLTASVEENGVVKYALNSDLTGVNSISSGKNSTDTKITLERDSVTLNNKKISGLADGAEDSDAVNLGQMNSAINTATSTITSNVKTVENKVTALEGNTIVLTGDGTSKTDVQTLGQEGGISFGVKGGADITTSASGSDITLSLNKATSVTNTGTDKDKVVTSGAVYTAVSGAKTKVAVNPETDGILTVKKTESDDLTGNSYTLSIDTAKLETEMKTSLNDDFAKVDASNLTDDNVTSWRNKLNVYSKDETYNKSETYNKTEVENLAKASKTEVKADASQSAITVTEDTTSKDGHTIYTVGFNSDQIATATNISYKAGADETAKTVSLSKGLNFQADANLTATSGDNGQITYGLKSDLTGITSISGPAQNDTKITLGADAVTLNNKRISGLANGTENSDAVNLGQMNTAIDTAKSTITSNVKNVENKVTALEDNTITFTGDSDSLTAGQKLSKQGGIRFGIKGNADITTSASGSDITLSLNKATSVTNVETDKDKIVTSGAVYTAVSGAKTKIDVNPETDGILTVKKTESDDLTGNSYTLSIDTAKLETEMKTSLNDDFAKVDASNLSDGNVTSWRNKLNVYSKEETYSKTEVDSKAKASKTEVKADDGQNAITVDTSTNDTDGHTIYTVGFNGDQIATATNIKYKAGSDATSKSVSLAQGLNFQADVNLTATSGDNGQITYGLKSDLTGITSISGPAGKDGINGTKITITEKGIDLGGKTISNIADGTDEKDAATVGQVESKITTAKDGITKTLTETITSTVKTLGDNTITLTGDKDTATKGQALNQKDGIKFAITGNSDITTTASESSVALSLNKAASVTNTGDDANKVVTSSAVYNAVTGAKTKVAVDPATDGILQVEKTAGTDLAGDTYTLSVNTAKLTETLDDSFAKKDASNLDAGDVTNWRTKLNVYSKEETYSKTEIDNKAKASKTEVKAADGQSAITVTKTQTSDGTNPDIYTVGFNGDQIATATNIKYKAGSDATSKSVSLAQGLNFQADVNLTATSGDNGQITYGLKSDLTGITSISGPAGKDGINGTKITITEKGIDLGGKTISNIADGTDEKDAATVGQVESKITTAKDGITKTLTETITSTVNTLGNNTITLTGDGSSTTAAQRLNQEGGISFGIKGSADITTSASGSDITLSLNKATSVTNTGDDANKVVTSSAVYNAVTGAKTKVAVDPATDGILQVEKTAGTDLAGDTYTLSVNTTKLTDALDDSFAKKDASNIKETEAGQWRTALNIYDKSEVDATTKASKTEVKAKDGQTAITVDKTTSTDGTNHDVYTVGFNGTEIAKATNLTYKANGKNEQQVALFKGLNFVNTDNVTSSVNADGEVSYALNSELKGITSISGGDNNGTKVIITNDGLDVGNKKISNLANGEADNDAVNVGQMNKKIGDEIAKISTSTSGDITKITEKVTKLENNTISFTGDSGSTEKQKLNKEGGISFGITGDSDITTTASESSVALSLNKATSVTNTGADKDKVITSGAVYTAVSGAKTKVAVDPEDGILTVNKTESDDLTGNSYTLSINTTKLENEMKTSLNDDFAKVDASNLSDGNVTSWRDKLNVYSKDETYSKTEIDNKASASKTEVKAADDQTAITVDKTTSTDGTNHDVYTVGFNGTEIAKATNISYKAGSDKTSKAVSLAQGLNFQADVNLTATSGNDGQITYGLNADLTGITSISGPVGKDGTNGTTITITENGIDLGGKTISNIADGKDGKDAATVGQVDSKIKEAKDGITQIITEEVTKVGNNTITLTGDKDTATKGQALNQKDGIKFAITGNSDITTTASESSVALSLNKATSVTNTGADKDKVITSGAVYTAVSGAKTKVAVDPEDGILTVNKTESDDLTGNSYTLSINTTKLENEMKTSLNDDFAKVDASNLSDSNVTSWRDKLNVYSKDETYTKTEVDSKAKESKTEVVADANQSAITVTKTTSTDGTNHDVYTVGFNGEKLAEATNISYKAGADEKSKTVSLSKGLNFQAGANLTTTSAADGQITYGLNSDLTGITSISGPAGKDGTNGTTITITEKGIDLGGKTISNIADGKDGKDAATVGQVDSKIKEAKDGITQIITEEVTKVGNNTITLTGDKDTATKGQALNQKDGIKFAITGNSDITTTASESSVALSLNKATSVTNTGADKDKVITSGAVYTAVSGAKTKVAVDPEDGILTVNKTESDDLTGNSYTLSINTTKLENEMKTSLNDDFAKVDASNLSDGNVTSWRDKLNVYSKDETYSKTEIDNKASASKTEVKAADGQSAITVTKTISTDGTNHDVYTVGFNGTEVAKATNISYKAGSDKTSKSVSLAQGLNFQAGANLTAASGDNGQITYGLKSDLTGITSITGPAGKDGTNGTTITITEKGIDLGGKTISNIADGKDGKDAATVGQVDSKIKEAKDGITQIITEEVTKVGNNTITLTGDKDTATKGQALNQKDGIKFAITGNSDITTTASESSVALSLNKATSVTNTGADKDKVITSGAVYTAVSGAKTKVAVDPEDGILTVNKTESDDLTGNSYTLSINTTKLENEMKTSLNDDFAKVDASNLSDGNVTSWRDKLNVYSKDETYSKTEIDNKASASKTEVKAADGQSAITVTKTISTDGTNHDVYTVGFNGEKLAEATNISYRIGDGDQQSVSLAKGFTFKAKDSNVTVSSDEDGEIVYGLNPNLTGITSITGPTGKDGSSTTITITEKGIDLGGKTISNIANGANSNDAATVGQVESKINKAKAGITKTITEEVTKVGNNTITLTGDDNSKTASQNLNQEGGINFAITGNEDITTKATGNGVALSLNKADSVVKDDTHVVTGGAVYDYVETVKGKITGDINTSITEKVNASKTTLTENTDGPITVTKGTKDGHDNYTIGINSDTMAEALHVAYKAGNDEVSKKVTLDKGFNFRASNDNLTVTSGENGIISYGLKANLKGITSISGPSDANGNHTTLTLTEEGLDLGGKKLTGLADGEGPTDAVTMNQFAKVTEKVGERLSEISKRANAGTAGALAAAGIPMITNLNDGNVMIGAGVGSYGGESAVAIGVSGVNTTRDISYRLSTSYDSTGKWGLSGGVGFAFGSGGEYRAALANNKALTKRVQSLETTNQSLTDANDKLQKQLDATNQQLAETNQRLGAKNDQLQQEVAELKALVQQLLENK